MVCSFLNRNFHINGFSFLIVSWENRHVSTISTVPFFKCLTFFAFSRFSMFPTKVEINYHNSQLTVTQTIRGFSETVEGFSNHFLMTSKWTPKIQQHTRDWWYRYYTLKCNLDIIHERNYIYCRRNKVIKPLTRLYPLIFFNSFITWEPGIVQKQYNHF